MKDQNKIKLLERIENFLNIIDDSTRMALLFIIIRDKEVTVEYLRETLKIKSNMIYYHLNMLEQAGLVSMHKEQVEGTNLSRKVYQFNKAFLEYKKDPNWKDLLRKNLKNAFLIEMYIAVASLMEAIQKYRRLSDEAFIKYFEKKKPQCDVLFLRKEHYKKLQSIINGYINELGSEELVKLLSESHEGYLYTIFAYPPFQNT